MKKSSIKGGYKKTQFSTHLTFGLLVKKYQDFLEKYYFRVHPYRRFRRLLENILNSSIYIKVQILPLVKIRMLYPIY